MTVIKTDNRKRVMLPDAKPGQVFAYVRDSSGVVTLSPVRGQQPACKIVAIPIADKLPDDPEWDKVEAAFGSAAAKNLKPE